MLRGFIRTAAAHLCKEHDASGAGPVVLRDERGAQRLNLK